MGRVRGTCHVVAGWDFRGLGPVAGVVAVLWVLAGHVSCGIDDAEVVE